jgi:hypothetical protein
MSPKLVWNAIFFGFVLTGAAHGGPIQCIANGGVAPFLPVSSSTLAGDIVVLCSNLAPAPVTLSFDVHLLVNTAVTSQVINPDGTLETVLLINEPDPGDILPGTNAFYAKREAMNALVWEDLRTGTWGSGGRRMSCRRYVRGRIGRTARDGPRAPRCGTVGWRAARAFVRRTRIRHAIGRTHRRVRAPRRRLPGRVA